MSITSAGTGPSAGGNSHTGDTTFEIPVGDGGSVEVGDVLMIKLGWTSSTQGLPPKDIGDGWFCLGRKYHATQGGLAVYVRQATVAGGQPGVFITIPDLLTVCYDGHGAYKKTDLAWDLDAYFSTADEVADATYSVDALSTHAFAAGHFLAVLSRKNVWDTSPNQTGIVLSAAGATISGAVDKGKLPMDNTPTAFIDLVEAECTAGVATAPLHFEHGHSIGEDPTGFSMFIFFREYGGPPIVSRPPKIKLISPPPGALGFAEAIVVAVVDPDGDLNRVQPIFTLPNVPHVDLAHDWDGPAFHPAYTLSTRVPYEDADGIGYLYTLRRNTGWVDTVVRLQVIAQDAGISGSAVVPATGFVTFTRAEGDGHSANPATIPAGTLVRTADGVEFTTDVDGDFAAFEASIVVAVTAVVPGTAGNVEAGAIMEIDDPDALLPDIFLPTVNNVDPTDGGGTESYGGGTLVSEFWEWNTDPPYDGDYGCGEGGAGGGGGGNRPVVEIVSPLPYNNPGVTIPDTTRIVFRVTDPDSVTAAATVSVTFWRAPGDADTATIPAGWIVKTPSGIRFALDEDATFEGSDDGPVTVTATAVEEGAAGNVAAGTVGVIEDLEELQTMGDFLDLTVTNDAPASGGSGVMGGGLQRAVPILIFPDTVPMDTELIHDGDQFYPKFAGSSRAEILGGFEYDIIWYTGHWPSRPKLLPFAYDFSGLEAL